MTDNQKDPRNNFTPRRLPWLLAAILLVIYLFTLNHWVSVLNLPRVARACGWIWQPELSNPLVYLITLPFHALPAALVPLALNVASALCAALVLGLLARTVALLPQDRTEAQRKREGNVFAFLTTRTSWLPPVLAVAVCGLQFTFWEHATNFTGEIPQLLLFAFVIWLLAEYRIDEREDRLFWAAFIYGAGMADNWAMVAFFPVFVIALIWVRSFGFFNLGFLSRMISCGLVGILFYFLLPLLAVVSAKVPVTFWLATKIELSSQWQVLKLISVGDVRRTLGLMSLTTLVPILVMAVRWSSSFGDSSRLGRTFANLIFYFVHAIILFVCVWVAFDPPFSVQQLGGWPWPQLTLHYLGAIGVGYFTGYLLLVLGKVPSSSRTRRQHGARQQTVTWNRVAVAGIGIFALFTIIGLFYKNVPQIRGVNDNTLENYGRLVEKHLPQDGGILLADGNNGPGREYIIRAALAQAGLDKKFLVLDTQSLEWAPYLRIMHQKYPERWPLAITSNYMGKVNPRGLVALMVQLSKTNDIFYLNPSFGYYFESFYLEPHGLVYRLKPRPSDTLVTPPPDRNLTAENESFWSDARDLAFYHIEKELSADEADESPGLGDQLLARLHIQKEKDPNSLLAGTYYSEALNFWGVQLQRAGDLDPAATNFETALKLNPDNVAAQINLDFNKLLHAGKSSPVDLSTTTSDRFGKYNNWNEVLNANGPFDEPSFCFESGVIMAQNSYFQQALDYFTRVRQLAPENLATRLWLGQLYVLTRKSDLALEAIHEPLVNPEKFSLTAYNSTELNTITAGAYFQKGQTAQATQLLESEIARHPDDNRLLTFAAQCYMVHELYSNALSVINRKLERTPNDLTWLSGKGYVSMQLKAYDKALATYNLILVLQTTNQEALFNRAVANLQLEKLDAARADYLQLQQTHTNNFPIAYGLGEIAWRQHETNEAIRNYEIYLAAAPTNTPESTTVRDRLVQLRDK
jgi:tetratricopeptide (TPR) repeat protein